MVRHDRRHDYRAGSSVGGRGDRQARTASTGPDGHAGPAAGRTPARTSAGAGPGSGRTSRRPNGGSDAVVAALLAADPGEISAVAVYSDLSRPPAVGHGATINCHEGSRIFITHVR
ncbi:hypothetical protein ACIF6L_31755 [Kitasatospora sp. NPDC086009]|uniref:hypothetical protein n=1 Tax=unclassified Kitasatospora TaxID=2633591 RepID=UPI0037C6D801